MTMCQVDTKQNNGVLFMEVTNQISDLPDGSANLETKTVENDNQNVDLTSSAVNDYKKDMFKFKNEARDLKAKLEEIQLNEEQRKGNLEGVINKLKEDLKEAKKMNKGMKLSFAENRINDAIKSEAAGKGITGQQLDVFMKLIDTEYKHAVELDDNFSVKQEDVSGLVEDHMKRYSSIFAKKVNVVDSAPNSKPINNPSSKFDLSKASSEETIEYLLKNKDKLK